GKTQLVLEYCYRHQADYPLIYWLNADDPATLSLSLAELAYTLTVAQRGAGDQATGDQATAVQAALHWLQTTPHRWLLIYDNADHIQPQQLPAYLPRLGNGVSLITSRNPAWSSLTGSEGLLRLDVFPAAEAITFLQQRSGQADPAGAAKLAHELGYLPLALEHAAAYIDTQHKSYAAYLTLYQQQRQALWARAKIRHDYKKTITTTWELAFDQAKTTPGAAELLNLCCFLDADAIPITLLTSYTDVLPESLAACMANELAWDDALTALSRYSLLSRSDSEVAIHRLVQAVGQDQMPPEMTQTWVSAAVTLLNKAWPFDQHDLATWAESAHLLPHLLAVIAAATEQNLETSTAASLNGKADYYLSY
ncbi:MAG: hypothetical protein GY824_02645, partial [Delftia sp.]|nr:hypothetical protein [Delftia sp.]